MAAGSPLPPTRADKATTNLYWQRADGTGEAERLTESKNPQCPDVVAPEREVPGLHRDRIRKRLADILILPLEGDEASGWKPGKPTAS